LDLDKIFEFYKKSGYETIDIVVMGRNPGKHVNHSFIGKEIGLAQRNTAMKKGKEENPNHFKVRNGKLTDADYLSKFVGGETLSVSEACQKLKRPLVTFLALDPKFFYSSQKNKQGTTPPLETMHDGYKSLTTSNTGEYISLPYGISFATPLNLPNTSQINNTSVSVLVNQMVLDNAQ
jgi:hypothetical protein